MRDHVEQRLQACRHHSAQRTHRAPHRQRLSEQSRPGQDRRQPPAQQAIPDIPAVMDFDMGARAVDQMCVVDLDRAG
jgi:hypothetical protein